MRWGVVGKDIERAWRVWKRVVFVETGGFVGAGAGAGDVVVVPADVGG